MMYCNIKANLLSTNLIIIFIDKEYDELGSKELRLNR